MSDTDFIREVDEELRDEQLKKAWDRYGPLVIAVALLIVLGTAASKGWDYWKESQAAQSGDAFIAAIDLAGAGKSDEAIAALTKLESDGSGGYPVLARMRVAAETAAAGEVDNAIGLYEAIAADASMDAVIQDLARTRAASLMLDQGRADDVILQLTSLMDNSGYRHSARELVLLAHLEKKQFDQAMPIAERIVQDVESPAQMRQRAEVYVAYIRSKVEVAASIEEAGQ